MAAYRVGYRTEGRVCDESHIHPCPKFCPKISSKDMIRQTRPKPSKPNLRRLKQRKHRLLCRQLAAVELAQVTGPDQLPSKVPAIFLDRGKP